jgi:hypothetical protein
LTPPDLDAIEARAAAATPGPWTVEGEGDLPGINDLMVVDPVEQWICNVDDGNAKRNLADAAFIAAARTDVPALVAALRASLAREAALREALAGIDERAASLEQDARTGTHGDACPRRIADDEHHRACEREDCDGACWDGVECDDCYAGAMIAGLAEIRTALRALATGEGE